MASSKSRWSSSQRSLEVDGSDLSAVERAGILYNRFVPHLQARLPRSIDELLAALNAPGDALAPAALAIARVECPALDPPPSLQHIDRLGEAAAARVGRCTAERTEERIAALSAYVSEEVAFSGK